MLEVLAAVLIFAVVFTRLATTAIEGQRSEGINQRRLEASLIGDRQFALLEAQIQRGSTPEEGEESLEEDIFTIETIVSAADARALGLAQVLEARDDDRSDADEPTQSLLFPRNPRQESLLRRVDLIVRWDEGAEVFQVARTTFAYDASAIEGAFPGGGTGELGEGRGGDQPGAGEEALEGGNDVEAFEQMIRMLEAAQ